jgi:predicted RNA binding protein YcfA (HicA-like mRNA interferase family)
VAKLPIVSGTEAVKALQRLGFFVDRQRGSHAVLKKITPQGERGCVIPMHREVALGTLRRQSRGESSGSHSIPAGLSRCLFFHAV